MAGIHERTGKNTKRKGEKETEKHVHTVNETTVKHMKRPGKVF